MSNTQAPAPLPTKRNIARQHRFWTRRAASWDEAASSNPSLVKVVDEVLARADPRPSDQAVDLGCGSGQVTLSLAPRVGSVLAVDLSEEMIRLLLANAAVAGVSNVEGKAAAVERLDLESASVNLVVSNYVLHHLRDGDKPGVVKNAYRWLRPGGRLVVGDMMFGRGAEQRDRAIIASKLSLLVRKGPAGWWRIAKNAARYAFRFQERPVSTRAWEQMFTDAGFEKVETTAVVNEAAVVCGVKPSTHESPRSAAGS